MYLSYFQIATQICSEAALCGLYMSTHKAKHKAQICLARFFHGWKIEVSSVNLLTHNKTLAVLNRHLMMESYFYEEWSLTKDGMLFSGTMHNWWYDSFDSVIPWCIVQCLPTERMETGAAIKKYETSSVQLWQRINIVRINMIFWSLACLKRSLL